MPEAQNFYFGSVNFPLTASTTRSLLRDADPAVYYTLEFFAQMITTHIGPRLLAEATAAGATDITAAVADSLPLNPEQFIAEEHLRFPLLTLHREGSSFKYLTRRRVGVHKLKLSYVLPPLRAGQAERLLPTLHAVGLLLDHKSKQGKDPAYTPTLPAGTAGEFVWSRARAGVAKVEVKDSSTGTFQVSDDLYFPAIVMSLEMWDLADSDELDGQYQSLQGMDADINLRQQLDGTTLEDVADTNTYRQPTITSISPTSGTKAGGTTVTITGTNFRVNTRPIVQFDGAAADAVTVVSATTITCKTPPHAAYPTFVADIVLTAADGQKATLKSAFTFTTP